MNYINVVVVGESCTGKTTICRIIEKALSEAGFFIRYKDPDDPKGILNHLQEQRVEALLDKVIIDMEESMKPPVRGKKK
jgi:ABC-type glutathione transport system ATPase component